MVNITLVILPLGLAAIGFIAHITFPEPQPTLEPLSIPLTPSNTVIVFDIHGVLFTTDYLKLITTLLSSRHTWTLFAHSINPFLWIELLKLARKNVVAQEYFNHLTNHYAALAHLMPFFISLSNAQKPVPSTVELVKYLKEKGYALHILSNIGDHVFDYLRQDFKEIFAYFDAIKVVSAQEGYQGKPHAPVFHNYLEHYNTDDRYIVFIDNKASNIQMAQSLGMIGVHYKNKASLSLVHQLLAR